MKKRTIACIAGARPNFMKVAPILAVLRDHPRLVGKLVHTGQHYDDNMSDSFFAELELPVPDFHLGAGSDTHARQTARIMTAFEEVLPELAPDLVLVVGDVNSTIACTLVAVKAGIRVGHVEAGLRSFDRSMPEEINRILTDQIADLHFITEESAECNLLREGVAPEKIHFTGNTMIDTLVRMQPRIAAAGARNALGLPAGGYAVMTQHRPSNVDTAPRLTQLVALIRKMSPRLPLVFPVHPRTRQNLSRFGLWDELTAIDGLTLLAPQPYVDFMSLISDARMVMTDSGGIQEETTYLGIPCVTQRTSTERPVTTTLGTNVLIGDSTELAFAEFERILAGEARQGSIPPLWDGRCAQRIIDILAEQCGG